jgi:hypothetical protein
MGLLDRCKALAITLAFYLISCGTAQVAKIDPKLQPYVDEFSKQFGATVNWVPTTFENLKDDWVGVCITGGNQPIVKIDPEYWEEADEGEREALIMHEYGHCILDRNHVNSMVTMEGLKIPKSVMHSHTFSGSIYLKFKTYYMKELFGR